ncbi:MAG: VIT and VWA domain-containing protein, partial [Alphaproteobacteria bacterium]
MRASTAAVLEARGGTVVLEDVRAEAALDDLSAEITVAQRYRNAEDTNIEAVYTFPLPLDGVLLGFEVELGDRKLAGMVVEKKEAERHYEDAITDGDAAVMLQQVEPGLYTANVGNLLPGETAVIRFTYALLLRWSGDRVRLMMPTTIAPRYGDPTAAGLAPHQAPEHAFDAERSFALKVAVSGVLADARFNSPSHDVTVAAGGHETIVEIAGSPAMDRDFVLEARASRPTAACAVADRDLDGHVVLASFHPEIPVQGEPEPRSIKIVVDCSGSMGGESMAQARAALERILDGLRPGDVFDIVAFGSSHRALFDREMAVAETSLAQARRFVRGLDAGMGGTEIGRALAAAYAIRGEGDRSRDLFLITDGQVWKAQPVIAEAKASGHRIFTVGVGSAAAEAFVRDLADGTGGACELVAPREDMADRIHRHFQRMYAPRARTTAVRWPAAPDRSLPDPIGAVYDGDTLHVFGWFTDWPEGTVALDVTLENGRVVTHEAAIRGFGESTDGAAPAPAAPPSGATPEDALPPTLARVAAARRMSAMEDDTAAADRAVRYQLMSRWTNYLVIHVRAEGERADDLPELRKVPQVMAAGWHGLSHTLVGAAVDMGDAFAEFRGVAASAPLEEHLLSQAAPLRRHMFAPPPRPGPRSPRPPGLTGHPDDVACSTPEALVAWLNSRGPLPLPTWHELSVLRLPPEIITTLQGGMSSGDDEPTLIAAFLYFLAISDAGRALDRQVR